jgi:hypothetical protein
MFYLKQATNLWGICGQSIKLAKKLLILKFLPQLKKDLCPAVKYNVEFWL